MSDVNFGRFGPLIGAIDEGTSSVRFIIFCVRTSDVLAVHQIPLKGIYPQEGYVEQDPKEIIAAVYECIEKAVEKLGHLEVAASDLVAIGVTNQRETAVAWDRVTGDPLYNAIVWSDMRTSTLVEALKEKLPKKDVNHFKGVCGLPLTPTFSAVKYKWLLDEVPAVKAAAAKNHLSLGTIDSWLLYNLTGGKNGGIFITDCTNASRTMLMNLKSLKWDCQLCKFFNLDPQWLPEIKSSSEIYGYLKSSILKGIPISGCLGDQQAALLGHLCLEAGQAKNTYGTGCFLLCNTGSTLITSRHGLIGTLAFKLGKNAPVKYAIEGSIAVAGSAISWLRDNLEILSDAKAAETFAESVLGEMDVYFVPAFSGLYAPYWEQDARGVIVGLGTETKKIHLIRAALEAVCFQTRDVLEAMEKDCGYRLKELLVAGGMTKNNYLMQMQADLIGIPVGALVFCVGLITYLTSIMAETQSDDMTPFANTAFTSKMYEVLRKTPGNVFFSPYSLQVALAMVYSGASGTTAQQIQKSAAFTENKDVLYKAVQDTANALTSSKDVILNVANAVYVQQNYPLKESFTSTMKGVFKAEAKELNFQKNVEAAGEINSFVSKQTKGKIAELFSPDAFNALTRLVLVNAVYFKGAWVHQFDPNNTYRGDFHLNKKDKVQVDFMKISKKFNALEDESLKATIVELPYEGDLSMVLIVPNEIDGIKHLEEKLKDLDLKNFTQQAYTREVQLTLPKFKLEQKLDLNEPLKELGVQDMFDSKKAEFDGITDGKDLYVSKVVQKAFIEVNEQGSEAAAATGVKFLMRMMPIPPLEVTADRPFFFFLTHAQGPVLFSGRLSHPQ